MKPKDFESRVFKFLGLDFDDDDPIWCTARQVIITGGWRSGKSTRGAAFALRQILRPNWTEVNNQRRPGGLIWLVGPDYNQAREEFTYLVEWTTKLGIYNKHNQPAEGSCTLWTTTGWQIITKSAAHPERLGSVAPDGVVMCEPGQMPGQAYEMMLGRLMQKGGWLRAVGTLESADKPTWVWYERMANAWLQHKDGHDKRAFSLPSWKNRKWFPGGYDDPKIQEMKATLTDYVFKRRIAGEPVGVEHPCFDDLWRNNAEDIYVKDLSSQMSQYSIRMENGAFGVDYGSSDDHPSTIVLVQRDSLGRYWVRDLWRGLGGGLDQIVAAVESRKKKYGIYRGRVDPKQAILAQKLGFEVALGSGPAPTDTRIGIANGLIEDGKFFFDSRGEGILQVFDSMRAMRRTVDNRGRQVYARDLGDDEAQAVLYAIEELHGITQFLPDFQELGSMKMRWEQLPPPRAGMVGRA